MAEQQQGKVVPLRRSSTSEAYVKKGQVAKHFDVSEKTVERWQLRDGFPEPLRSRGTVRYRISDIETWLRSDAS